jgi:hypothetical protein
MAIKVGVLIIHGMGSQTTDFADPMIKELRERIQKLNKEPDDVTFRSIYWADILESQQLKYLRDAEKKGNIDFKSLRRFILTAFGDASAYRKVESDVTTTYEEIHARVAREVEAMYKNDLGSKPKPLVVLAHSLGGHIMSNYIWDMQKLKNSELSPFERMNYVTGIFTFGCNIPFFTFAYKKIVPIKFPHPRLPVALKAKAKWFNYYDPDDVLGYPLKPICQAYNDVVDADKAINIGGVIASWNPMSHTAYWTDNDLTKPVAKYIAEFL